MDFKLFGAALAAAAGILAAAHAHAAPITFSAPTDTHTVAFVGQIDQTPQPGLSAEATLALTAFDGTSATFAVTLENTTDSSIWDNARLRSIAFDVNNVIVTSATSPTWNTDLNVNFPDGHGFVEVCAFHPGPGSCLGGAGGLAIGDVDTFDLTLVFAQPVSFIELGRLAVRFQALTSEQLGFDDASGIGLPVPVPEPGTLGLLGAVLLGMGLLRRRRL